MTLDPDHVRVLERLLHVVSCWPGDLPYERYARKHRRGHEVSARRLLDQLHDAGYTLTNTSNNLEEPS